MVIVYGRTSSILELLIELFDLKTVWVEVVINEVKLFWLDLVVVWALVHLVATTVRSFACFGPCCALSATVLFTPQGFFVLVYQIVGSSQRAPSTAFAVLEVRLVVIHFHVIDLLGSPRTQTWWQLVWHLVLEEQRVVLALGIAWAQFVMETCLILACRQFLCLCSYTSLRICSKFSDFLVATIHYAGLSCKGRSVADWLVEVLYTALGLLIIAFPLFDVWE